MDNQKEFLEFASSLKLIRKAEIEKSGRDILNDVYTDILPNNGIIEMVNLPRTSILRGRKGTGKSTIFRKSIKDMENNQDIITIYIDVKTLFDSATPKLNVSNNIEIQSDEIKKYFIYKNFLFEAIDKARESFRQTYKKQSIYKKLIDFFKDRSSQVEDELNEIKTSIDDVIKQIDLSLCQAITNSEEYSNTNEVKANIDISPTPNIGLVVGNNDTNSFKKEFTAIIGQYFDVKKCLIDKFLKIREILDVKYIYIYLDDYSEMDEESQEIFMDWFICPLNNSSDDFIKFKIATYPSRFYAGKLDNQKYDEINLDFYSALYSYKNISKMEEISIDYIRRLINNRFNVFLPGMRISDFFDIKENELYELLFDITLSTPREIGFLLTYCYATHITFGKKITKAALGVATQRYFEEVTQQYFETNRYVIKAFQEMASKENLKCLVDKFIDKQRENDRIVNQQDKRGLPTSHFIVDNNLCKLLSTLELNGYISTYNKVNDKDNIPSTLFALNYGICQKYGIPYGRPKDTTLRQYYLERKFTFNNLIKEHFNTSQIIECPNGHIFPFDQYEIMNSYGMVCPTCARERKFVTCSTHVTNKNIIQVIEEYNNNTIRLGDDLEYGILNFLRYNNDTSYKASEIARDLDCSYQLITKRADKLIAKELILIDENKAESPRYFLLTQYARDILENEVH